MLPVYATEHQAPDMGGVPGGEAQPEQNRVPGQGEVTGQWEEWASRDQIVQNVTQYSPLHMLLWVC
jgi:hypothetical protein